jgi:hypothetical protein
MPYALASLRRPSTGLPGRPPHFISLRTVECIWPLVPEHDAADEGIDTPDLPAPASAAIAALVALDQRAR